MVMIGYRNKLLLILTIWVYVITNKSMGLRAETMKVPSNETLGIKR